jgi:hypothetical protein
MFVHQVDERFLGARDRLGQHDAGVVARQGDDAVQKVFYADLLVRRQEHRRSRGGAMPAAPCLRVHRDHLVQLELALVDKVERHVRGHHLGHRRGRNAAVGVAREQHRARGQVFEIRNRRGSGEGRRRGLDGECEGGGEEREGGGAGHGEVRVSRRD